jgi:curved DNA-binding protein CbpA
LDTEGYYAILGVTEGASYREIRTAFRRLAKRYHPDVNSSLYAEETIKKINAAFEVLSDKEKRQQYDRTYINNNINLQKQEEQFERNNNDPIDSNNSYNKSPSKSEDKDSNDWKNIYSNRNFYFSPNNDTEYGKDKDHSKRYVKPHGAHSPTIKTDNLDKSNRYSNRYKIIVEPSLCMAFGSCETLAPKVFVVEKDKIFNPKAKVISEIGEDFDAILAAAQTCPTKAILIIDRNTGEYIYP